MKGLVRDKVQGVGTQKIEYFVTKVGSCSVVAARLFDFVGYSGPTEKTDIEVGRENGEVELLKISSLKRKAFLDLRSKVQSIYNDAERAMLAISAIVEKENG